MLQKFLFHESLDFEKDWVCSYFKVKKNHCKMTALMTDRVLILTLSFMVFTILLIYINICNGNVFWHI